MLPLGHRQFGQKLQCLSYFKTANFSKVSPANADREYFRPQPRARIDEKAFRWRLNQDAMATEKLAEGIRSFAKDLASLREMVAKRLAIAA